MSQTELAVDLPFMLPDEDGPVKDDSQAVEIARSMVNRQLDGKPGPLVDNQYPSEDMSQSWLLQEEFSFQILPIWDKSQHHRPNIARGITKSMLGVTSTGEWQGVGEAESEEEEDGELDQPHSCFRRFLERVLGKVMIAPSSPWRIFWDLVGFLLVSFEFLVIPLQAFEPERTQLLDVMPWIVRIFFSLDLPLTMATGYTTEGGMVEMRPCRVAKRYASTFMIFDIGIVTLDWLELLLDGTEGLGAARVAKVGKGLRLLRVLRLVRVMQLNRMPEFVRVIVFQLQSERFLIAFGVIKILIILIATSHMLACGWYGVGMSSNEDSSWVELAQLDLSTSLVYRYLSSFHWALTQFCGSVDINPVNTAERLFAVLSLIFGFFVSACVVSSITSSMTRLQIVFARQSTQISMLNRYLVDNGISTKVAMRVKNNAMYALKQESKNINEVNIELLMLVSDPLRVELHYEIHLPVLGWHPFFRHYNDVNSAAMRRTCHEALSHLHLSGGDTLFSADELPQVPSMYFCLHGKLQYSQDSMKRPSSMVMGTWACEAVLWTQWVHMGVLRAKVESTLLLLNAARFQKIALQFQTVENHTRLYAEAFIQRLNEARLSSSLTDLDDLTVDLDAVCSSVFPEAGAKFFDFGGTDRVRSEGSEQSFAQLASTNSSSCTKKTVSASALNKVLPYAAGPATS